MLHSRREPLWPYIDFWEGKHNEFQQSNIRAMKVMIMVMVVVVTSTTSWEVPRNTEI